MCVRGSSVDEYDNSNSEQRRQTAESSDKAKGRKAQRGRGKGEEKASQKKLSHTVRRRKTSLRQRIKTTMHVGRTPTTSDKSQWRPSKSSSRTPTTANTGGRHPSDFKACLHELRGCQCHCVHILTEKRFERSRAFLQDSRTSAGWLVTWYQNIIILCGSAARLPCTVLPFNCSRTCRIGRSRSLRAARESDLPMGRHTRRTWKRTCMNAESKTRYGCMTRSPACEGVPRLRLRAGAKG